VNAIDSAVFVFEGAAPAPATVGSPAGFGCWAGTCFGAIFPDFAAAVAAGDAVAGVGALAGEG
jgi:hypothetical protein